MLLMIKLAIVAVGFALTRPAGVSSSDGVSNLDLWNETSNNSANFKCGLPQRRSVRISSLVEVGPHDVVYPSHVIVDRCDDATGTCTNMMERCSSSGPPNLVQFAYLVVNPTIGKREVHRHETESHTQCGCTSTDNPIK